MSLGGLARRCKGDFHSIRGEAWFTLGERPQRESSEYESVPSYLVTQIRPGHVERAQQPGFGKEFPCFHSFLMGDEVKTQIVVRQLW